MNFPYYIAKRYLFSKSGNNAINIITFIATFGVIVSSLALFVILSAFSGLRIFSESLLNMSDPDIKITATKGKSFFVTDSILKVVQNKQDIQAIANVIEERVFLQYGDKTEIANIKGVNNNYNYITNIDSAIVVGQWLDTEFKNSAILGDGISSKLSIGLMNGEPLKIYVPKPGKGMVMNPNAAFSKVNVQVLGIYSGTEDFENKYVFVDISLAQELLKYKNNQVSAIEIKLKDNSFSRFFKQELQSELGTSLKVQTRAELNALYNKVLNTENFLSYLIFTLVIIIALFNVIGAVIMMIIDKKANLITLYKLGTPVKEIKQIFVLQGFLLTVLGMLVGLTIAIILVLLQKQFSFFMITPTLAYPVEFSFINLAVVIATITILGFFAAKIASSRITENFIEK